MPRKGLFARKDSTNRYFRIHKGLYDAMLADAKKQKITVTEAVNLALAARYMPHLIHEIQDWKLKPRYNKKSPKK